jgi:ABC-2 type transport system permease protein
VFVTVGVVCFAALGVAFSHAIPNFESTAAYVNAVFLPLIFVSGVFYDAAKAPRFLRDIAEALPLVHVIDGLSGAMVKGTSLGHNAAGLGVVALWGAAGLWLAARGFSWEARRS